MADVDELFEVKNALYTGNFQHCINESQKAKVNNNRTKLYLIKKVLFIYKKIFYFNFIRLDSIILD